MIGVLTIIRFGPHAIGLTGWGVFILLILALLVSND